MADAEFRRYRHLDCEQLEKILADRRAAYRRVFLVTESVFSMDGDAADLKKLVGLKKKYDCILVVDEAPFGRRPRSEPGPASPPSSALRMTSIF